MMGRIDDMTAADYHAAPGLSQTHLKHLARSAAHYRQAVAAPDAQTPAMLEGQIFHHLLLTPEAEPFWVLPPLGANKRTKEYQAWKDKQEGPIVDAEDIARIGNMVDAVRSHPVARKCFSGSTVEVSIFLPFNLGGTVLRKGRLDCVPVGNCIIDFKTIEDAREASFQREIITRKYHLQAAYYLDLWNETANGDSRDFFVFIAVEKQPPHGIAIYQLDADAIQQGRREYIELLQYYIECESSNTWPCYASEVQPIGLPKWAAKS